MYGFSTFPHADTSSRVVVFRVRLRGRLVASWVRLVILSIRFGWPLWLVVLRVGLITDHPGSPSFFVMPFVVSLWYFIVLTLPLSEAIIRLTFHKVVLDSKHLLARGVRCNGPKISVWTDFQNFSYVEWNGIGSFRLDYEYEIEYEYDFRISHQWRFQSPCSSCW